MPSCKSFRILARNPGRHFSTRKDTSAGRNIMTAQHRGNGIASVNYRGNAIGPRKRVQYTISTLTDYLPGAGTTAGVFIQLHGTTTDSKRFRLLNAGERSFERAKINKFLHTESGLNEITTLVPCCGIHSFFANEMFGRLKVFVCACLCVCKPAHLTYSKYPQQCNVTS